MINKKVRIRRVKVLNKLAKPEDRFIGNYDKSSSGYKKNNKNYKINKLNESFETEVNLSLLEDKVLGKNIDSRVKPNDIYFKYRAEVGPMKLIPLYIQDLGVGRDPSEGGLDIEKALRDIPDYKSISKNDFFIRNNSKIIYSKRIKNINKKYGIFKPESSISYFSEKITTRGLFDSDDLKRHYYDNFEKYSAGLKKITGGSDRAFVIDDEFSEKDSAAMINESKKNKEKYIKDFMLFKELTDGLTWNNEYDIVKKRTEIDEIQKGLPMHPLMQSESETIRREKAYFLSSTIYDYSYFIQVIFEFIKNEKEDSDDSVSFSNIFYGNLNIKKEELYSIVDEINSSIKNEDIEDEVLEHLRYEIAFIKDQFIQEMQQNSDLQKTRLYASINHIKSGLAWFKRWKKIKISHIKKTIFDKDGIIRPEIGSMAKANEIIDTFNLCYKKFKNNLSSIIFGTANGNYAGLYYPKKDSSGGEKGLFSVDNGGVFLHELMHHWDYSFEEYNEKYSNITHEEEHSMVESGTFEISGNSIFLKYFKDSPKALKAFEDIRSKDGNAAFNKTPLGNFKEYTDLSKDDKEALQCMVKLFSVDHDLSFFDFDIRTYKEAAAFARGAARSYQVAMAMSCNLLHDVATNHISETSRFINDIIFSNNDFISEATIKKVLDFKYPIKSYVPEAIQTCLLLKQTDKNIDKLMSFKGIVDYDLDPEDSIISDPFDKVTKIARNIRKRKIRCYKKISLIEKKSSAMSLSWVLWAPIVTKFFEVKSCESLESFLNDHQVQMFAVSVASFYFPLVGIPFDAAALGAAVKERDPLLAVLAAVGLACGSIELLSSVKASNVVMKDGKKIYSANGKDIDPEKVADDLYSEGIDDAQRAAIDGLKNAIKSAARLSFNYFEKIVKLFSSLKSIIPYFSKVSRTLDKFEAMPATSENIAKFSLQISDDIGAAGADKVLGELRSMSDKLSYPDSAMSRWSKLVDEDLGFVDDNFKGTVDEIIEGIESAKSKITTTKDIDMQDPEISAMEPSKKRKTYGGPEDVGAKNLAALNDATFDMAKLSIKEVWPEKLSFVSKRLGLTENESDSFLKIFSEYVLNESNLKISNSLENPALASKLFADGEKAGGIIWNFNDNKIVIMMNAERFAELGYVDIRKLRQAVKEEVAHGFYAVINSMLNDQDFVMKMGIDLAEKLLKVDLYDYQNFLGLRQRVHGHFSEIADDASEFSKADMADYLFDPIEFSYKIDVIKSNSKRDNNIIIDLEEKGYTPEQIRDFMNDEKARVAYVLEDIDIETIREFGSYDSANEMDFIEIFRELHKKDPDIYNVEILDSNFPSLFSF